MLKTQGTGRLPFFLPGIILSLPWPGQVVLGRKCLGGVSADLISNFDNTAGVTHLSVVAVTVAQCNNNYDYSTIFITTEKQELHVEWNVSRFG